MQKKPYSVSSSRNILNRFREFEKHLVSPDARFSEISDSPIINNLQKFAVYLNTVCPQPLQPHANVVDPIAAPAAAAIAVGPASSAAAASDGGAELGRDNAAVAEIDPIGAFKAQVTELFRECDPSAWRVAVPDASLDTSAFLANVRLFQSRQCAPCQCAFL